MCVPCLVTFFIPIAPSACFPGGTTTTVVLRTSGALVHSPNTILQVYTVWFSAQCICFEWETDTSWKKGAASTDLYLNYSYLSRQGTGYSCLPIRSKTTRTVGRAKGGEKGQRPRQQVHRQARLDERGFGRKSLSLWFSLWPCHTAPEDFRSK